MITNLDVDELLEDTSCNQSSTHSIMATSTSFHGEIATIDTKILCLVKRNERHVFQIPFLPGNNVLLARDKHECMVF